MTACPGCGEEPEQISTLTGDHLGLVTFHRGGCTAVPEPPRCTCYDPASMEFGLEPCPACRPLERDRAHHTEPEGIAS